MSQNSELCQMCILELDLLQNCSQFGEDEIEMYAGRYGVRDGEIRSWWELSTRYGCDPEEVCFIVDDVQTWLDANSAYRFRARKPEDDPHRRVAMDFQRSVAF
jgi:hypothetical protein